MTMEEALVIVEKQLADYKETADNYESISQARFLLTAILLTLTHLPWKR